MARRAAAGARAADVHGSFRRGRILPPAL
jgi:hypothetical protein